MTEPVAIRLVGRHPSYVPMVTNNWLMSGDRGRGPRAVPFTVWTTYEHALIERYWRDPAALWLFAANPADTNFVYGWLCGYHTDAGPVLHYTYVRKSMRDSAAVQPGIATALMRAFVGEHAERVTHTRVTADWERKVVNDGSFRALADEWFYNPYLAFQEFMPAVVG